jgi:hypothetical protein
MNLKKMLIGTAIAAAALIGTVAAADAAVIRYGTSIYANPGWGKIGFVPAGTWVDIQGCTRNYCWIEKPGTDGFVRASAIRWDRGFDYNWWFAHPHSGWRWGGGHHMGPGIGVQIPGGPGIFVRP